MAFSLRRRRTKIVCTIGPATRTEGPLRRLIHAGMDCARLNFSHGNLREHLQVIELIRKIEKSSGKRVAILQDLPGPKFRVGTIPGDSIQIKKGSSVILSTERGDHSSADIIPLRSGNLPRFVPVGGTIFLSDGSIRLKVLDSTNNQIKCRCEVGGLLFSGKGINVPELKHGFETFTNDDKRFLSFGLEHGVDMVAVSFVRKASDVESVRKFARKKEGKKNNIPIISKIEKREALDNIQEIVDHSDALMVARGDLGVENPLEQVPELQKQIISSCSASGVPVITATQMLESMVSNPSPTRAEVTDVANAIFDGTDALMLSEETAVGKYPTECVKVLNRVSLYAESVMLSTRQPRAFGSRPKTDFVSEAVGRAAASISNELRARAIVTVLDSIEPLCQISRLRPLAPIIAMSTSESRLRKLNIIWGVYPMKVAKIDSDAASIATLSLSEQKKDFLRSKESATIVCLDRGTSGKISMRMQVLQIDN